MDVVIRSAVIADAARIGGLLDGGALPDSPHPTFDVAMTRGALQEILASDGGDVLVATVDGEVVGVAQLITFRHLQHRGGLCAEIESMHVDEARRAQGVGGVLLDALVDAARARGCYRVQLTSNNARVDAHRFYARHGFIASHRGFKLYLE